MIPQKEMLQMIVESMLLIAVCDKDLDSRELDLITGVIKTNWQEGYGNPQTFVQEISKVIKDKRRGVNIHNEIQRNGKVMARCLERSRKDQVLKVLSNLMAADKFIYEKERKLFNIFKEALNSTSKKL